MSTFVRTPCEDSMARLQPATAPVVARTGAWVLTATILGSSLSFIDGTAVNVALPIMQRELRATAADVQWVVEAYALFLAALILVGGSLGDRLGRKRVFATGIALFTAASVVCGLAPSLIILDIARAVQGVGGALLVPGSLAIISAAFDEERRGAAIGTWSALTTITSAAGPVLGGWLVQSLSWRWIFFINVPLAAITLLVTARWVPESHGTVSGPLDLRGSALVTLGLGALVFGLIESSSLGLGAPLVLASLAVGVAALVAFVIVEARSSAPMVPLSLFRSRTFAGTNLLTLFLYGALGGALYFLPFNLLQVQGYTPAEAGAALLPMTLIIFALSRWAGGLVRRVGARLPLVIGSAVAAAGFALFAVPGIGGSYWTTYFPAIVVLSLGMSLVIAPLTTTVMNSVGANRAGIASGVNNAVSRTAGLLAVAVLNLVVIAVFAHALATTLATSPIDPALRRALLAEASRLANAPIPSGTSPADASLARHALDSAFVAGFRAATLLGAALALGSSLVAATFLGGHISVATNPVPSGSPASASASQ